MSQQLVYLASASPRRAGLLEQIGVRHEVRPAAVDETPVPGEAADDYVLRLAKAKAAAVAERREIPAPVLGADTAVVVDERILGKPATRAEALSMPALLSGRRHRVLTAVAVIDAAGDRRSRLAETLVDMRPMEAAEMRAYWESGEPRDKAGAYAIQGRGGMFVERIEGSYSAVVGLPLAETAALLVASGVELWPDSTGR